LEVHQGKVTSTPEKVLYEVGVSNRGWLHLRYSPARDESRSHFQRIEEGRVVVDSDQN
jgi:hypothetical protein